MSSRETVLASIRRSLGVTGKEAPRLREVADRIGGHPAGIIPARGQLPPEERLKLFIEQVEAAAGTIEVCASDEAPKAIAAFMRRHNLPMKLRRGADARLAALPWASEPNLEIAVGASEGADLVAVSHAAGAVAETGTLVLASGPDNPTTLNFLPDSHVVVVSKADIAGDYEAVWTRLRETYGVGKMPRVVNWITGPSRSADIEQTLILGAHGPRRLHVIVTE